jgi:hypothetical protein
MLVRVCVRRGRDKEEKKSLQKFLGLDRVFFKEQVPAMIKIGIACRTL